MAFSKPGGVEHRMQMIAAADHLVVKARGDQCQGAPELIVRIDGKTVLDTPVTSPRLTDFSAAVAFNSGWHLFEVFADNVAPEGRCARRLLVDTLSFTSAATAHGDLAAEDFSLPENAAVIAEHGVSFELASAGKARATTELSQPASALLIRARGDQCLGAPLMTVSLDDNELAAIAVAEKDWNDFTVPVAASAGVHHVTIDFSNDMYRGRGCDRNLYVQSIRFLR